MMKHKNQPHNLMEKAKEELIKVSVEKLLHVTDNFFILKHCVFYLGKLQFVSVAIVNFLRTFYDKPIGQRGKAI